MSVRVRISLPASLVFITVAVCLWAAAASSSVQAQSNDPPVFSSAVFIRTVSENVPLVLQRRVDALLRELYVLQRQQHWLEMYIYEGIGQESGLLT